MELADILLGIRNTQGDTVARAYSNNKKCDKLFLKIESMSMSLQMEFNRIQGSTLHQLKTKKVGSDIRNIIEDGINEIIDIMFSNERVFKPYLAYAYNEIKTHFDEIQSQTYCQAEQLHLTYNFDQIAWQIKDFDYQTIIRMLECLIITYAQRRFDRRKFMPTSCYS